MKKSLFAIALIAFATVASAQVVASNTQTIALNATLQEAITLDQPTASAINFAIVGSPFATTVANGDVAPTFNVNYSLKPGRHVNVCAWLAGALQGTTGNLDTISTSHVLAKLNGQGSFIAFTGTACGQPSGLVVDDFSSTSTVHSYVKSEKIELQIGVLGGITPDTYTGTLNLIAQTI